MQRKGRPGGPAGEAIQTDVWLCHSMCGAMVALVWWQNLELTFCSKNSVNYFIKNPFLGAFPKIGDWV